MSWIAYLVYKKKLSLVCPEPSTYAIVEIIPSRIRCESKILRSRLELTYSMNYESFRSKKCLNSSTDCRSVRLLELPGRIGIELRPAPFFFFFILAGSGLVSGASEVLNWGDAGL